MRIIRLVLVIICIHFIACKTASVPAVPKQNFAVVIVTLLNGDTLHGTTPRLPKIWEAGDFTGSGLSMRIEVKTNRSWKTKIYKPDDIKNYQLVFPNGRISTFYSSSTNDFIPMKDFPWGNFGVSRRPAFLYHAAGTKLKDYRIYYSKLAPGGIYGSISGEQAYLVKNDKEYFAFSLSEKKSREELMEFLKECPTLVEMIKNDSYKDYHSHLIAKDYDDCMSSNNHN